MAVTVQAPESDHGEAPERAPDPRARRVGSVVSMVGSLVLLAVLAVFGYFFWPLRFGGSTTVVWVSGESMEPTLSNHDLVVARHHDNYEIGDVIVYRVPGDGLAAGEMVVHRIVGGDAVNGYLTRGDNRTSNDPWLPTAADVLGEVVVEMQHGTLLHEVIERTASPGGLGVMAGVGAAVMVFRATRRRPTDSVETVESADPAEGRASR
jgi:signal peptidase